MVLLPPPPSSMSQSARYTIPGCSAQPNMVWLFPEPVGPYTITVHLAPARTPLTLDRTNRP
jgi:hypothetical protein